MHWAAGAGSVSRSTQFHLFWRPRSALLKDKSPLGGFQRQVGKFLMDEEIWWTAAGYVLDPALWLQGYPVGWFSWVFSWHILNPWMYSVHVCWQRPVIFMDLLHTSNVWWITLYLFILSYPRHHAMSWYNKGSTFQSICQVMNSTHFNERPPFTWRFNDIEFPEEYKHVLCPRTPPPYIIILYITDVPWYANNKSVRAVYTS